MKRASAALLLAILGTVACGKDETADGPLKDVSALVILQRTPPVGGMGDVLQYTAYQPGGRLTRLSPPSADGVATTLCCSQFPGFEQLDINSYDIAFDAKSIVFAGRLSASDNYSLYILTLNDLGEAAGPPTNLAIDPNYHFVQPIFVPGQRIVFMTNKNVEGDDVPQFKDEYERGETSQLGSISVMGTGLEFAPRNLSHRVNPTMMASGQVLFAEWRHLGDNNSAQLTAVNPDFSQTREIFGREGSSPCNSVFKAREVDPGRLVALCSSRDRTIQAGKILDISLGQMIGGVYHQSEALSSFRDLTPLVPGGREPSDPNVGRYYNVAPIPGDAGKNGDDLFLLVSWANGPVEDETLGAAGLYADFGIFLFDSRTGSRLPIFNDPDMWDVDPRILAPRPAPQAIEPSAPNGFSDQLALVGGLTVSRSSLGALPGEAVGVNILEGFSGEEGFMEFGLDEHEGSKYIGTARVMSDNSWAALINGNIPFHVQPIDAWGVSLRNEDIWQAVGPGDSAVCGGCHEARDEAQVIQPGVVQALAQRPVDFGEARATRGLGPVVTPGDFPLPETGSKSYSWNTDLQGALDAAKCGTCHNGDPAKMVEGKRANRQLIFTEMATMTQFTYTFDLRRSDGVGEDYGYTFGDEFIQTYSASHLGLIGYAMDLGEMGIELSGDLPRLMLATNMRESPLLRYINPSKLYPYDTSPGARRFPNMPQHPMEFSADTLAAHDNARALTPQEALIFIRIADAGNQFYGLRDRGVAGY